MVHSQTKDNETSKKKKVDRETSKQQEGEDDILIGRDWKGR